MKCITFRRWYPGSGREVSSWTYPIETDAHKISLVDLMASEADRMTRDFVCERIEQTWISIKDGECYRLKRCLQFFQCGLSEDEDEFENSLTFPIDTDTEKIAFANWIIEHKLGDFRHMNTHVFISEMYLPTVGEAVMVPIAEAEN